MQTSSSAHPTERLTGAVERVTFHSEETGFCVLRVKVRCRKDLVTVVGMAATITPGEYVEGEGWWITDRTHGLQFKTRHLRVVPPSTLDGIEKTQLWDGARRWAARCQKSGSGHLGKRCLTAVTGRSGVP